MRNAVIIGSGISGMTCAVRLAEAGVHVTLISPFVSERSQSVMAAGGINAFLSDNHDAGDTLDCHIEDTLRGGGDLAGRKAVSGLCEHGEEIIKYLERIGTVFSLDSNGRPARRAFGGQTHKRTFFCGSSTGKQIVSALVMEARRLEAAGLIERRLWSCFYSALIEDGVCCGALVFDETTGRIEAVYADALVMATGGQNALFGKTTGSTQCDGYAAGKLFLQGVELKNLEFIQYHPTTLETSQKRMLISEAVRGEGGRLFYYDETGGRVYFLEDKYGPKGNLMTRDLISREIESAGKEVFLDITFLGEKEIGRRLPEVRDLCLKYRAIDISREPIPVAPSVHFFMGGIAVHLNHETNIRNLFAVGECASMYHGANRLGGNSLLAAVYSGMAAAQEIAGRESTKQRTDFDSLIRAENAGLSRMKETESRFPVMYLREAAADTLRKNLGIVRRGDLLEQGIKDMDFYLSAADRINYDRNVMMYWNYSVAGILTLGRAALTCALSREESRGSHYRSDYPERNDALKAATIISYDNGEYHVRLDKEQKYES